MQSVIGALVIGLLGIFAIVIGQGIAGGQNTAGWPAVLVTILQNITPIIGIITIISMFILVIKSAGGLGVGGLS